MKNLSIKSINKILINKKELEEKTKVKIEIKGKNIILNGEEIDEYLAEKIIEAIELGFSTKIALLLTDENYILETMNIKLLTKKNPRMIRGRIIGTKRKTLDTIEEISDCKIVLHDNIVGIIAHIEDIKGIVQAISNIIKGAKTANVYSFLERLNSQRKPFILQLKKE